VPKKKNTIAKIGVDVVSFAGRGTSTLIEQHHQKLLDELLAGHPATGPPALLTTPETAVLLRCSVSILNKWRLSGAGPVFVKVGARVRYRLEDIARWIAQGTRRSTSATGPPATISK
jgi:hypothetical protein